MKCLSDSEIALIAREASSPRGDYGHDEGLLALVAEIEERRTADPKPEDVAKARDIIEWCDGLVRMSPGLETHREIARLLRMFISATGAAP